MSGHGARPPVHHQHRKVLRINYAGNPGLVRSPQVAANFFQPGFRDGGIVFEIGFKSEDVAELFRREFGGAAHSTCDRRSDDRPPCSAPILCSSA